jgi:hypothetical protein
MLYRVRWLTLARPGAAGLGVMKSRFRRVVNYYAKTRDFKLKRINDNAGSGIWRSLGQFAVVLNMKPPNHFSRSRHTCTTATYCYADELILKTTTEIQTSGVQDVHVFNPRIRTVGSTALKRGHPLVCKSVCPDAL